MASLQWLSPYLTPFISLSYPTKPPAHTDSFHDSTYYDTGPLDACIVITCIAVMAVLRDIVRIFITEPFARWMTLRNLTRSKTRKALANGNGNGAVKNGDANGHGNGHAAPAKIHVTRKEERAMRHNVVRFAEQSWPVICYTVTWSCGFYIHYNLPTRVLDPTDVWLRYPHAPIAGTVKLFYLFQNALYLHQILILNAEARRKDHVQMMTHHVITVALLVASYLCHLTRVGCLILVIMDWCDIYLPLAKMLRYMSCTTLCDMTFVFFLVSWFVTRHILFNIAIWSTYDTGVHHLTPVQWKWFMILLVALQIIQIIWFFMIARVAYRVVAGQNAEDTRSDDEGDDEDDKAS